MPKNQQAVRFVKNLTAAYGKWRMGEETADLYLEKLEKWHLSPEEWSRATSRIIAEITDNLPALGVIYGYLKAAQATNKSRPCHWVLFDLAGRRYAIPCPNPSNPPLPPDSATNLELVVDRPYENRQPLSLEQARECFRCGWIESGAALDRCEEMFKTLYPEVELRRAG